MRPLASRTCLRSGRRSTGATVLTALPDGPPSLKRRVSWWLGGPCWTLTFLVRSCAVPSHHKGKEEKKESEDEESAPLLPKEVKSKRPHPFVMLLKALWPFGEAFRELGILGKIYETIKVCSIIACMYMFCC